MKIRKILLLYKYLQSYTSAIFLQDYEALSVIPWRVVVVDEAHRLRTDGNKLTGCLREILAKGEVEYEALCVPIARS